ncbi:flagellar basal body-associated protein FliL [Schumannella luteola]|uniref:Flagellar basal body-associated protein FliL n=1 Tax=Schumannella luteola TaxID=472059 RepID=A0A852YCW6_9MICO|nr:flagellar basal body-associated protein FliL [Schumannella luteola]
MDRKSSRFIAIAGLVVIIAVVAVAYALGVGR